MKIKDRIRGFCRLDPSRILPNPRNWRTHPEAQRDALQGVLADVGIADAVLVVPCSPGGLASLLAAGPDGFGPWLMGYRGEFMLVDGHLRAETITGQPVPALVLDLDEREQAEVLATFDPVGDLAGMDRERFIALAGEFNSTNAAVQQLVSDLASMEERMRGAAEDALPSDGGDDEGRDETERGDSPPPSGPVDEDDAPPPDQAAELAKKWGTAAGQLWEVASADGLRVHHILCGDCRVLADVARVMGGRRINVAFTSPPYASQRKYDEASGFKPIHPDAFVAWFEAVQAGVREWLAADGSWFVNIKEHCDDGERHLYVKDLTIAHKRLWGWRFIDELIWRRTGIPGEHGNLRFRSDFEPVFHFSTRTGKDQIKFRPLAVGHESDHVRIYSPSNKNKNSQGNAHVEGEFRSGIARPGNVLDIAVNVENVGHSAMFPVNLPVFFIRAYSDPLDAIFDPFLGSGTTIVAAEKTGRIGHGIELSPKYVAVALERLSKLGLEPRLATP